MSDLISRQAAVDAMWKALYAYEDLTEKQFMEHEELELEDWFQHRIFVQRMHEECMKAVESLPSAEAVEVKAEQLPPKVPPEWINEGMVLVPKHDWIEMQKKLEEYASAEAQTDGDMGEVSDGYHTFNQLYHQRAVLFATIVKQNKEKAWKSWKHEDGKFCFDSNKECFIVGVDTPEGSYTYHYKKKYWDMFDCVELEHGKFWDGHTEEDVTRLLSLPSAETEPTDEEAIVALLQLKRCEQMEQILIDALRMAQNKDTQAILLETYIQEYGAISDDNGEIVRQILMDG